MVADSESAPVEVEETLIVEVGIVAPAGVDEPVLVPVK